MKWFKHYTKALTDAKIEKLIMKYGIEGYGLYFACLEIIAGNTTDDNITFELEHDAEILAYKFKLDTIKTENMMKYMIELGLFEINTVSGRISCYKLATYIDSSLIKNPELLQIKKHIREDSRKLENKQENSSQIRLDKNRLDKINKDNMSPLLQEILCYLNLKANRNYRYGIRKTEDLMKARLNQGFTKEDFFKVINIKCSKWLSDPKMNEYLRPETLFGTKFESYLNEKPVSEIKNNGYDPALEVVTNDK